MTAPARVIRTNGILPRLLGPRCLFFRTLAAGCSNQAPVVEYAGSCPLGLYVAVQVHPYRWRVSGSLLAHLLKATTQQHHRALAPTIARLVPSTAVVFDVGAHAGQYTKLFARAASHGRF